MVNIVLIAMGAILLIASTTSDNQKGGIFYKSATKLAGVAGSLLLINEITPIF